MPCAGAIDRARQVMIDRVEGLRLAAMIVAASLLCPGCTAHRLYREVSVEAHPDYHLAFARSESLGHPTTLAVALDGTLWLGDLPGQTITTIAPDGSPGVTIHRLSGAPRP